ncbi:MAG TPA: histidine--tRNA ligase [Candidatus Nanoarchaeia archaeon]|nr:histidine--tRNA ligase [Candidatus Nanoarchaeia archaeon]
MAELMNARGTRDFGPEDKILRQELCDTLREMFELYGFSPLETPILERYDVLAAKYDVGSEILKEIFKLSDQGDRDLCLRYDFTVPLARFVGMNKGLKMPFKRYAMGPVFRDGPLKIGRYREFWQCDCDIVGSSSMVADAQLLEMFQTFFSKIGLSIQIEINNRKILDGILEQLNVAKDKQTDMVLAIDKLKKIGLDGVEKELREKGMLNEQVDELLRILSIRGSNREKLEALRVVLKNPIGVAGINELEETISYMSEQSNVLFSVSLARGLAYYTGNIYEVFLQDQSVMSSSLGSGGRWDNMIANFIGSEQKVPAVGISFGLEPILDVLRKLEKVKGGKSLTQAFVVPIKTLKESVGITRQLRLAGIKTDIDLLGRNVGKNLEYASAMGIPFCVIVGPKELAQGIVTLRDMSSGDEKQLSIDEAIRSLLL